MFFVDGLYIMYTGCLNESSDMDRMDETKKGTFYEVGKCLTDSEVMEYIININNER